MPSTLDIAQDGNLFPREELLEAAAGADWRDRGVPKVAWLAASIGLSFLAAGTAVTGTLYRTPTEFAASGDYIGMHPLHLAARTLGGATGMGIEAALFLISALSLGAAFICLGLMLRAFGFAGRLAFPVALLACVSQTLTAHGRLPSDYLPGVCASALLIAAIALPRDPGDKGRAGYAVRISAMWLLASWVSKDILALFPALVIACATPGAEAPSSKKWIAPLVGAAVIGAAMIVLGIFGNDPGMRPHPGEEPRAVMNGIMALWALWPLALLSLSRAPEEAGAPKWVAASLVLAFAWVAVSYIYRNPASPTFVAPIAACLAANGLSRVSNSGHAALFLVPSFLIQLAVVGGFCLIQRHGHEGALAHGPGQVQSTDLILIDPVRNPELDYLLRRRHGFRVADPSDPLDIVGPGPRGGQRVVGLPGIGSDPRASHWLIQATGEVMEKPNGPHDSDE